ncbi:hypothetical protein SeMB42_g06238 [Synchytrium endobioticum]|uniref:Uncharacterized protein n=1 Tax=Synchytrium endobioticum TaxID=286115 RepID=A0A507CJU5_9FUNG|nr:hypothetical protein SeMB42_g06238 [Synchytrium endobioticum]
MPASAQSGPRHPETFSPDSSPGAALASPWTLIAAPVPQSAERTSPACAARRLLRATIRPRKPHVLPAVVLHTNHTNRK